MTEIKTFATREEADAFMASFHRYTDPASVSPLKGEAAHEVAVGPVHAGVIEPGHFRFQCMGEDVYNLQIFLGYQHRGVEEEIVKADGNVIRQVALAETCAGDSSIAAATAFSEIMESVGRWQMADGRGQMADGSGNVQPTNTPLPSTLYQLPATNYQLPATNYQLRSLLLELERIANHVGDLGALAGDVAFLPTASFCGRIRGEYLNMTALICGNRFGRNAVVPGGMRVKLTCDKRGQLKEWIARVKKDLDGALKLMFEEPSVLERFEGTGVVSKEIAEEIGLVGVARRASVEFKGDVLSRAMVRRIEIEEAHQKVFDLLEGGRKETEGEDCWSAESARSAVQPPTSNLQPAFTVVSATVNAWRGPLVHAALFDGSGRMLRYKIVDPSAHNWQGLAYALRGEQISNFPICNKSFNLAYCGTDR